MVRRRARETPASCRRMNRQQRSPPRPSSDACRNSTQQTRSRKLNQPNVAPAAPRAANRNRQPQTADRQPQTVNREPPAPRASRLAFTIGCRAPEDGSWCAVSVCSLRLVALPCWHSLSTGSGLSRASSRDRAAAASRLPRVHNRRARSPRRISNTPGRPAPGASPRRRRSPASRVSTTRAPRPAVSGSRVTAAPPGSRPSTRRARRPSARSRSRRAIPTSSGPAPAKRGPCATWT